ncbi:hypothetical protein LINPERHAP1_LOCUS2774 [Linum perenne]
MAEYPSPPAIFFLLQASIFLFLSVSSPAAASSISSSYKQHCSSMVPHSNPTEPETTTVPFLPNQGGYYIGGDTMSNFTNSSYYTYGGWGGGKSPIFLFRTHHVHKTDDHADKVYKVEADLVIENSGRGYYRDYNSYSSHIIIDGVRKSPLSFKIEGFWSLSSGNLCMVGSALVEDDDDHDRRLDGVLKLYNVWSTSNLTSLIAGTLESLNPADHWSHFKPISMLIFPEKNYEYNKHGGGAGCDAESNDALPRDKSLSLPHSIPICSPFFRSSTSFRLDYMKDCINSSSSSTDATTKKCSLLGDDVNDHLPRFMSLSPFQCSSEEQNLRFGIKLLDSSYVDYYSAFSPNTTLVSEGTWDAKNKRLCIVACRIRNVTKDGSFHSSWQINDCSIRISLRFPSTWSIGNTNNLVGEIWSTLDEKDSGYFSRITVKDFDIYGYHRSVGIPGFKYEYTMAEKVNSSCPKDKPRTGDNSKQFPDGRSNEMRFDMSLKDYKNRKVGWARAEATSVGDEVPSNDGMTVISDSSKVPAKPKNPSKPVNISYSIKYTPLNVSTDGNGFSISAEGVYKAETGYLCMVGCKYASPSSYSSNITEELPGLDSKDCEVLVKIEFPSIDSNDYIQGSIKSMRKESDSLYFKPLTFTAYSFYGRRARESVWRMDLEVIMSLASSTLLCFFVAHQIFHVKRNPEVFPFLSILMLLVLTLGNLIPLVLNFEALFSPKKDLNGFYYMRRNGVRLEVDEVILRVLTMFALLLQLRLLQLAWLARQANKDKQTTRSAERKTLFVALPLYIAGALISLCVNWKHYEFGTNGGRSYSMRFQSSQQHSLWMDLRSYAGLVLDGFLLPQILLNIFHTTTPQTPVLSRVFLIGTTLVRLVPHGYDFFRARNYVDYFTWSYMYANPDADYYSTVSDVVIPLMCLLFAVTVHFQQRLGGRCFFPKRFRKVEDLYQKVAATDDEERLEWDSHKVEPLPSV